MLTPLSRSQIEALVHRRIRALLEERFGEARAVSGGDKLNAQLGLTSLDLAFLVSDLEAELGVDPFAKLVSITSVRSVDDLVHAYHKAFFPQAEADGADGLAAAAERAELRRARRARR
jgi:acyl carrier protein